MRLRKLKIKDAPLMLQWMHDPSVVHFLHTNFSSYTLENCNKFIDVAQDTTANMHLAITDEADEYMGTVSLKHIISDSAEFAITVRKEAMGKGISKYGMRRIIDIGINELGLKYIYWCVSPLNERAIKFYDNNGYQRAKGHDEVIFNIINQLGTYTKEQIHEYIWYVTGIEMDKIDGI